MDDLTRLIHEAQRGDLNAYGTLVQRFQDMAVGYAYVTLNDFQLAEDAAQEAFIEAHACLPTLREPKAFPSWLRRIIFKQCDRLTRGKRFTLVPLDLALDKASDYDNLSASLEGQEMKNQILNAVQSLPEQERAITTLFYMGEYSHKEISAFLDIPLTTVNNRLRSARKRLKERMMEMVQETLQEQRPSRDAHFKERVMAFINAADSGYADQVKEMLQEHPDLVDVKGKARYSTREVRALHYALNYGHVDVIEALLASGADVNAKADEQWAPLHYALRGAHPELAEHVVEKGATVDIYAAAGLGDLARVEQLCQENGDLVQQAGPGQATPLHFATTASVARFLLSSGADVNAEDERGRTALEWQAHNPEVVQLLLSQGAEIRDIFLACSVGDVAQVKTFLDADASLVHTHKDARTSTPLAVAADKGHVAVAQLLLERGADVNAKSKSGAVTPLHDAAFSGRVEMVKFLLAQGADPTAQDTEFNAPPLAWARFNGQREVMALLE